MPSRLAIALLLVTALGCKDPQPEAAAVVPPEERVRPIDLPFSRRSGDTLGPDATLVLVAFDGIAVDGHDVVPLTRGDVATTSVEPIGALASAIPPGRTEARVRMHTAVKHATLLALVASLRSRGVTRIGFEVRKDSMGSETGLLVPAQIDARASSREPHVFAEPYLRAWDQIPEVWDDAYVACDESRGFDCSRVTERVAFGGDAEVALFRRQNGVILDFTRYGTGGDVPAAQRLIAVQNTRRALVNRDAVRSGAPPETHASFGFLWASLAAQPEAPLARVMKELTRPGPVGVRVSADSGSDAGAVITLIGAAFPDGVPAPALMLDAQAR